MRPQAVVVLLVAASTALAQSQDDSERTRIEALIAQLADPDAARRHVAAQALRKLGLKALPLLETAKDKHDDPEVRQAAKQLWESIPRPRRIPKWAKPAPGTTYDAFTGLPKAVRDKRFGIELVLIPAGKFMMGVSPGDEEAELGDVEHARREVVIPIHLYLGKYEVTNRQWAKVVGRKKERGADKHPVANLSWKEIQPFLKKSGFRLPTDAEWEYACRGGTIGSRYGDLEEIAWWRGNSDGEMQPVGKKRPNAFGLYDMLGNAWEWCADSRGVVKTKDWSGESYGAAEREHLRVLRGGGARNGRKYWLRASVSAYQIESYRNLDLGFRVARDP